MLDHAAVLGCINPRALGYSYRLDPLALRAALAATLHKIPCLAGRLVPDTASQINQALQALAGGVVTRDPRVADNPDTMATSADSATAVGADGMRSVTVAVHRTWKPPAWWRTPLGVGAAALAGVRRRQAYSIVMCNAGGKGPAAELGCVISITETNDKLPM